MSKKQKKARPSDHAETRRQERFYADLSAPMIFAVCEAVALFALILIGRLIRTDQNAQMIRGLQYAALPIYLCSAGVVCLIYAIRNHKLKKTRLEARRFETEIYDMFRDVIDLPYAIADPAGKVMIFNGALQDILGFNKAMNGIPIREFCKDINYKTVMHRAKNRDLYLTETITDMPDESDLHESMIVKLAGDRRYEIIPYVFKHSNENYYFLVFRDVEDYLSMREKYEAESPVVAYIQLDNLQELAQYVRADYRAASAEAENILRAWVLDMHGFIREHSRDSYIAVFSQDELQKQIEDEFDVQKRIMSLKIGDNSFPITVSMGISAIGSTLEAKEKNAFNALNMAIQRGGNQVAIRREDSTGYVFFGGTHKTIENNTTIVSRVSGDLLASKIREASNVIIMGHSNPDFDSIGSCIGAARFAMSVIDEKLAEDPDSPSIPVNIVVDKSAECFTICAAQLAPLNIYDDMFIERAVAKDYVSAGTVLLICDVNNSYIFEAPELARFVHNIAIIDHHRMAGTLSFEPFLQYIEATKSSASEIVSEILMHSRYADTVHKEEAEVLLSGIMLDTKNFTRNAGAQTFETTHYLYTRGAHTNVVREFFNESIDELMLTGEFESKARIYRDDIAITWMTLEGEAKPRDRVIAAKVADNLLSIKGVRASFALIKIDNDVVISGRSKGEINVQLILERLKGGGHFDIAGAQIKNGSLTRSCEMLKSAIDDYFEVDHHR